VGQEKFNWLVEGLWSIVTGLFANCTLHKGAKMATPNTTSVMEGAKDKGL
jgi:hypothetical protein